MKEKIIKHINAILCAICVVSLALPFSDINYSTSAFGVSASSSESVSGFTMVTDAGIWGFLFVIAMAAILATNYIAKFMGYKKIVCLAGPAIMIISLFLSANTLSAGGGGDEFSANLDISYGPGFFIILVATVLLLGIGLIRFLDLKGNAIFDLINCAEEGEETETPQITPNIDLSATAEKIGNATKNITETVTQQAGNIVEKAKEAAQSRPAPQPKYNSDLVMEQINKLFEMKEKGVLTEEEFTQKKAEFLNKLQ